MSELSIPAVLKWAIALVAAQWLSIPLTSRDALVTLMIFTAFDIATGWWASWVNETTSSRAGYRGFMRKAAMFGMILFVHILESRAHIELHLEFAGALAFTFNEIVSTVENFYRIDPNLVPAKLVQGLLAARAVLQQPAATKEQIAALAAKPNPAVIE